MKEIIVVAGVLYNNDKILLAKRNQNKSLGGKWEFPGGKVEKGETHKRALKRELIEEFGVAFEIGEYIGSNAHEYRDFIIQLHAYKVPCSILDLSSSDHDEVHWVNKAAILSYDLADADIPIVDKL
ncbi:MAG: (deoxy)nucleoside triphosphate pyrophosphohydrolase [Cyclobacteriaceae bacterium]|nr:(deoxy)nucleoside triphosphate pyrophosphohydrolase [Cyclobacteriaceae bacterium]MDH4297961.1 (deoxy)nucleoside triphosphate pyrophosphohydrolase [Cyclobacteriaceae bacterium]MDH5250945.1 (deoxy)nucleoside triphosphate pyrophosphohydrolase [Cyclobacteriaceae bacterium]